MQGTNEDECGSGFTSCSGSQFLCFECLLASRGPSQYQGQYICTTALFEQRFLTQTCNAEFTFSSSLNSHAWIQARRPLHRSSRQQKRQGQRQVHQSRLPSPVWLPQPPTCSCSCRSAPSWRCQR